MFGKSFEKREMVFYVKRIFRDSKDHFHLKETLTYHGDGLSGCGFIPDKLHCKMFSA
jgi:hypothetical protein